MIEWSVGYACLIFTRNLIARQATVTWVGLVGFALSMTVMMPRRHGKFTPDVLIDWPNRFLIVTYAARLNRRAAVREISVTHPAVSSHLDHHLPQFGA